MTISNKLAAGIFSLLGSVAIASPSIAAPFAPSFTNPAWTTSGDVTTTATTASLSNAFSDGNDDLTNLNLSGTDPTLAGGPLESFLGVSVGTLDVGGSATEGSAIRQVFTAVAGEVLTFDLAVPVFDSSAPDIGFVLLNGSLLTFSSPFTFNSGALPGGSNTIEIGVVDINDFANSTQLLISNVTYIPVPFEFSPGLGVASIAGLYGLKQLRKRLATKK